MDYPEIAYEAYRKSAGGVSIATGEPIPAYKDLPAKSKVAFDEALTTCAEGAILEAGKPAAALRSPKHAVDTLDGLKGPDGKPLYVIDRAGQVAQLRRALQVAINTVECASTDQYGTELPWYVGAKAALADSA